MDFIELLHFLPFRAAEWTISLSKPDKKHPKQVCATTHLPIPSAHHHSSTSHSWVWRGRVGVCQLNCLGALYLGVCQLQPACATNKNLQTFGVLFVLSGFVSFCQDLTGCVGMCGNLLTRGFLSIFEYISLDKRSWMCFSDDSLHPMFECLQWSLELAAAH